MIVSNKEKKMKKIDKNTGSSESQIFFFTERVKNLNEHMKNNKHDYVTRLSLEKIINKRKKMLKYLKKKSEGRFNKALSIIK